MSTTTQIQIKRFRLLDCRNCMADQHRNCIDKPADGAKNLICGCSHAEHLDTHYDEDGQFVAYETVEIRPYVAPGSAA